MSKKFLVLVAFVLAFSFPGRARAQTGFLGCIVAGNVAVCPPSATSVIGVYKLTGQTTSLATSGTITITLATSSLTTSGHYACTNATAGTVVDSASACGAGQQVGIIARTNYNAVSTVPVTLTLTPIAGTTGTLVCVSGSTLISCPVNGTSIAGVFTAGGNIATVNTNGYASVNLITSGITTLGDYACSGNGAGIVDNGTTACAAGQQAGFIGQLNHSPVSSVPVFLTTYAGNPGPQGPPGPAGPNINGLGNGINVIDAYINYAQPISSTDLKAAMDLAIVACSPGPCEYDLRGFKPNWTVSGVITPPEFSVIDLPNGTGVFAVGAGFDLKNAYIHLKGETQYNGTYFTRTNTSTDYTPYIFTSGPFFIGNEIDHIRFGTTTASSLPMATTSVDSAAGGHAVYHGTYTACATNACVGREAGIRGFIGHQGNDGYFNITASTATTLTTDNAAGVAETPSPIPPMYAPFIVLSGGWAIRTHGATTTNHNNFHDNLFYSSLGTQWADSGCNCYNAEYNDQYQTTYGGEYWGQQSTDNTISGNMVWTSNDQTSSPANFLTTAAGYGLWLNGAGFNAFNSVIGIESSRYSVICEYCQGNTFGGGFYINNPFASGYGVYNATSGFWLQGPGNVGNVIADSGTNNGTVLDTTGANPPVNKYLGVSVLAQIPGHGSGSLSAANMVVTAGTTTPHCTGTCATTRYYNVVPVDTLGNRGAPFSYDGGAGVANAATLDATHYDSLSAPTMTTLDFYSSRCWDILVSTSSSTDYSTSLATCVTYTDFTGGFTNNGTLTPVSYTQPLYQIGTVLVGNALIQPAAKTWAGTCSMSSGTTCTFTAAAKFLNGIIYIASDQTGTLAGKCSMNLTTNVVTITASGSNSDSWACTMIGNPN